MDDELTTAETATLLGVDSSTVRRYADANLLVVRRTVGGHRRYTRASVENLLATMTDR